MEFLEVEPSCGFVFSPLMVIDATGNGVAHGPRLLGDGVYPSEEIVPPLLSWDGIPGGSVVARRSAFQEVGEAFCDLLPHTYDYEMWVRLALRARVQLPLPRRDPPHPIRNQDLADMAFTVK